MNEIIFVSGQRGSGKSYWVKSFIKSLPRCLIYDSLGEYQADQRFFDLDPLLDYLIADENSPRLFSAVFDPYTNDDFGDFCRAALARGNLYVVIEEIDLFATPYNAPDELLRLIKYGRHYNVQIVGVSRRPAEVSRMFTAQCSRFVIFHQKEPVDIKYFRSTIGGAADLIPQLDKFHYLDIDFSNPDYTPKNPITGGLPSGSRAATKDFLANSPENAEI